MYIRINCKPNIMKRNISKQVVLAIMSLIAHSSVSFCQDKSCEYAYDEIDKFTKRRTIKTTNQVVFDNKGNAFWAKAIAGKSLRTRFSVAAAYDGGDRYLYFAIVIEDDASYEDYDALQILLQNDTIVNFLKPSNANYEALSSGMRYWKYYSIDDSTWQKIKSSPIKTIRMHMRNGTAPTIDIEPENSACIIQTIKCIDVFNLPTNTSPQSINPSSSNASTTSLKQSNTLNTSMDPAGQSIYRLWRLVMSLTSNGQAMPSTSEVTMLLNSNGHYLTTQSTISGGPIVEHGQFSIDVQGKIFTMVGSTGRKSIQQIVNLNDKELILRDELNQVHIYTGN